MKKNFMNGLKVMGIIIVTVSMFANVMQYMMLGELQRRNENLTELANNQTEELKDYEMYMKEMDSQLQDAAEENEELKDTITKNEDKFATQLAAQQMRIKRINSIYEKH